MNILSMLDVVIIVTLLLIATVGIGILIGMGISTRDNARNLKRAIENLKTPSNE